MREHIVTTVYVANGMMSTEVPMTVDLLLDHLTKAVSIVFASDHDPDGAIANTLIKLAVAARDSVKPIDTTGAFS